MEVYINEPKPEAQFECWLGNREFLVTHNDKKLEKFMKFIINQGANYVNRYTSNYMCIIYFIFLDICEFNKVIPNIRGYMYNDYTILAEPAIILNDKIVFGTEILKLFFSNKTANIITFNENINYNLDSSNIMSDELGTYLSQLIMVADHLATHYIASVINKTEPDYISHADFKTVGFTFSNVLDINVLREKSINSNFKVML